MFRSLRTKVLATLALASLFNLSVPVGAQQFEPPRPWTEAEGGSSVDGWGLAGYGSLNMSIAYTNHINTDYHGVGDQWISWGAVELWVPTSCQAIFFPSGGYLAPAAKIRFYPKPPYDVGCAVDKDRFTVYSATNSWEEGEIIIRPYGWKPDGHHVYTNLSNSGSGRYTIGQITIGN